MQVQSTDIFGRLASLFLTLGPHLKLLVKLQVGLKSYHVTVQTNRRPFDQLPEH